MSSALIIGSGGQDGQLLLQQLRSEGCHVLGIAREGLHATQPCSYTKIDILDAAQVRGIVAETKPEEIYYLAAFHHSSQEFPASDLAGLWQRSFDVHVSGLLNFLEAMRLHSPASRLFYAASSHVFGDPGDEPQNEHTPLRPQCVYGITKTAGLQCVRFYRREHALFAAGGILYNHESGLRAEHFVSQKIVRSAMRIKNGKQQRLSLGDLSARADWGYAPDFVHAMRAILALDTADDFVVATGEAHSVQEFVEAAFGTLGLDWKAHVDEEPALIARRRNKLRGDASKLGALTGWRPTLTFTQMVERLIKESGG
jgi:GDPmannose 4,6-dehydratase